MQEIVVEQLLDFAGRCVARVAPDSETEFRRDGPRTIRDLLNAPPSVAEELVRSLDAPQPSAFRVTGVPFVEFPSIVVTISALLAHWWRCRCETVAQRTVVPAVVDIQKTWTVVLRKYGVPEKVAEDLARQFADDTERLLDAIHPEY